MGDDAANPTDDALLAAGRAALVELGAGDVRHSGGSLLDHLVGTAELLRSWGAGRDVWLAGLLHSVHGTGAYDRELVAPDDRAALRELAGDEALALVDAFERLDRPALTAAARGGDLRLVDRRTAAPLEVTAAQGTALVDLTVANWLELRHRQPEKSTDREVVSGYHALAAHASPPAAAAVRVVPVPSAAASRLAAARRAWARTWRRGWRAIARRVRRG